MGRKSMELAIDPWVSYQDALLHTRLTQVPDDPNYSLVFAGKEQY